MQGGGSGGGGGQSGGGGGMAMLMRAMEREECEAGTSLMEQVCCHKYVRKERARGLPRCRPSPSRDSRNRTSAGAHTVECLKVVTDSPATYSDLAAYRFVCRAMEVQNAGHKNSKYSSKSHSTSKYTHTIK